MMRSIDAFAGYGYDPSLVNARVEFGAQDADLKEVVMLGERKAVKAISTSTSVVSHSKFDRLV